MIRSTSTRTSHGVVRTRQFPVGPNLSVPARYAFHPTTGRSPIATFFIGSGDHQYQIRVTTTRRRPASRTHVRKSGALLANLWETHCAWFCVIRCESVDPRRKGRPGHNGANAEGAGCPAGGGIPRAFDVRFRRCRSSRFRDDSEADGGVVCSESEEPQCQRWERYPLSGHRPRYEFQLFVKPRRGWSAFDHQMLKGNGEAFSQGSCQQESSGGQTARLSLWWPPRPRH